MKAPFQLTIAPLIVAALQDETVQPAVFVVFHRPPSCPMSVWRQIKSVRHVAQLLMLISLKKIIDPGSLRDIGSIPRGVEPHKLVSGGHHPRLIAQALGGKAYAVGRTNPRNAFCVEAANTWYLFAHRDYADYRAFFHRFFQLVPTGCDVDHVLSKGLAKRIGVPYLLLAAVPRTANRSHASVERRELAANRKIFLGKTFLLDERMFHKVMGRRVGARQKTAPMPLRYRPGESHDLGVTLKQRGIWNQAFCIDVVDAGRAPRLPIRQI